MSKSTLCWKEETTEGTSLIAAVNTATSLFGKYEQGKEDVEVPTRKNIIKPYHNYASRTPKLVYGNYEIPTLTVRYNPVNCIGYYHFLGDSTDGDPSTLEVLESAVKPSITIHHQEDMTVNHIRELLGAKAVSIAGKIEINTVEEFEILYAGKQLKDGGGGAPMLTTEPTYPEGIEDTYFGKPKVTWDDGGAGEKVMNEVKRVDYSCSQNISVVHGGSVKTINCHQFNEVEFTLIGVLESEDEWDALVDEDTIGQITTRSFKKVQTNYKDLEFTNCKPETVTKLGKIWEDAYLTTMKCKAEVLSLSFIDQFGANFADWY